MNAVPDRFLSLDDYFLLEETSEIKYEYYQDAAYAMIPPQQPPFQAAAISTRA